MARDLVREPHVPALEAPVVAAGEEEVPDHGVPGQDVDLWPEDWQNLATMSF